MTDDSPEEDGTVLSPDDLDITDDQHVAEIGEGRYLISPDDPVETDTEPVEVHDHDAPGVGAGGEAGTAADGADLDAATVDGWLEDHVASTGAAYGFHVTASFEGEVASHELYSDDVVTTFQNLLTWYTEQVGRDTPVEEALAILLLEANTPIRFPPEVVAGIVEDAGLSAEDSIADLLAAAEQRGGVRLARPSGTG